MVDNLRLTQDLIEKYAKGEEDIQVSTQHWKLVRVKF